eukprot:jgi/Undpi1/2601/HiC_scaffold_13.g05980.m1
MSPPTTSYHQQQLEQLSSSKCGGGGGGGGGGRGVRFCMEKRAKEVQQPSPSHDISTSTTTHTTTAYSVHNPDGGGDGGGDGHVAVEVTVRVEVCFFPRRSGFAFSQTARVRDGVRPGFVLSQAVEAKVKRGVYHPDSFEREAKYGVTTLVTTDEGLKKYLGNVIQQLKGWLMEKELQRLVLVVVGTDSGETLERWTFHVHKEETPVVKDGSNGAEKQPRKPERAVKLQIQDVIRQITSTVTFLPMLDEPCSFDLLVYTGNDATVPTGWGESDPRSMKDSAEVTLRSFSTKEVFEISRDGSGPAQEVSECREPGQAERKKSIISA